MPEFDLSWIASLKQWRKRRTVEGKIKTFYLGTGNGPTDKAAYAKALAKWRDIEKDIVAAETAAKTKNQYEAWAKSLGYEVPTAKPEPMNEAQKRAYLELANSPDQADLLSRHPHHPSKPKGELIGPSIDEYI